MPLLHNMGMSELRKTRTYTKNGLGCCSWGINATDKGLDIIKELISLETLKLNHTKITDKGFRELNNALPKCEIK